MLPKSNRMEDRRVRVVIEGLTPEIEGGSFPVKRVPGERLEVEADIFADGHDQVSARLLYRRAPESEWTETPMEPLVNDRWRGAFTPYDIGEYVYTITAWVDRFKSWRNALNKRQSSEKEALALAMLDGAALIRQAAEGIAAPEYSIMLQWAATLESPHVSPEEKLRLAFSPDVTAFMERFSPRDFAVTYPVELHVRVERSIALFGSWYEMFPRSSAAEPGRHGTFRDCAARLPYIAEMGFDVLYLPPIHPIGRTNRKGKNNSLVARPEDPGTPWAIGDAEGGHKAVNPLLGTLADFHDLMASARQLNIEIALDLAYQCSPDHPYVKEHPEWFRHRPDGTIRYAENPPKKYEDIYPFDFETSNWRALWDELRSIVYFWLEQGVGIFRVDNPHTKPFVFWEWLLSVVKKDYPDAVFLSEAFTRPRVMYRLAKLGFSQSYTYFAWRNTKWELTRYFTELNSYPLREYFRPSLWPNTPDILTEYLQFGGRPAFITRLVLAATLGASYGIYGPAFELMVNQPREPGSEEYLDSEKYEIKHWDIDRADSLRHVIARVNGIRRENPALHNNTSLRFHTIHNDQLIAYSKHNADFSNIVLVVANLDSHYTQSGWVELEPETFGVPPDTPYQVHELLTGGRYLWSGRRNYVQLDPNVVPAHIFRLRRRVRTEHDFDYFM